MAELNRLTSVQGTRVLYNVKIYNNTPDAEFDSFDFDVVGNTMGLSTETVENGIRALANSIAATSPMYQVSSITKTAVTETNLSL